MFLAISCGMWNFLHQESNPCPLQWTLGVLITGPSGKPLFLLPHVNQFRALCHKHSIHLFLPWLEIPKDRGAWWAIVYGVAESQTRLSDFHFCLFEAPSLS